MGVEAFTVFISVFIVLPIAIGGTIFWLYWSKITINRESEKLDRKRWLRLGKKIFVVCAVYGVVMGSISYDLTVLSSLVSSTVLVFDFPGYLAWMILTALSLPLGNTRGLLIPSIVAWIFIGFIPYAMAKFKRPSEPLPSSGQA